ncbi:MAG: T9SS type A sorting domain-containing protein [Sediminibacterium sp.]
MKSFATALLCLLSCVAFSQPVSRKTFLITANSSSPLVYNRFTSVDMKTGKAIDYLFDGTTKKYNSRNNGYNAYQPFERRDEDDASQSPLGGSVAGLAYDAKNNRLFYIPLQSSELRYMDLKESTPSFTCLSNQSLNLLHGKDDVANQITRMAIGSDGFGYALSNDGEHLIKFSTSGTPVIQDMGVLIDNPKNQVFVRSSCTSWGGDMVAGADGNLYVIALHNHVFKVSLPGKKCDYIGTIKNLPEEFTSNGASVDDNGDLLVSCGSSYGKKFSPVYKVNWSTLEATPVNMNINNLGNIADMASSNLLFQETKKAENNTVAFTQTAEKDAGNETIISIFPNPVNHGRFQIRTTNIKEKGEYRMSLLDVNGKAIMEAKMNLNAKVNTNSFNFPVQYAKGVYFVQISDVFNRTVYSQQLIVE